MGHFHFLRTVHPLLHLFLALLIIESFPVVISEIKKTKIVSDNRPLILFERFGFNPNGHAGVSIKQVSWKPAGFGGLWPQRAEPLKGTTEMNPTQMGFFLLTEDSYMRILNESGFKDHFCVVSSRYVKLILTFDDLGVDSSCNKSLTIEDPGEYSLVFGNCQPGFEVSMNVFTEMYNLEGEKKNFLSAGQAQLPKLYFLFFLVYFCYFLIWVFICIKQRTMVDKIHILMAVLLLAKALKLICASEDKSYVKRTGTSHGWDIAFYIFGFIKGIMLFTVIVLIGTGWSFLKPYLQEREKNVLMTVIPLQVIENIASVVIGETGPFQKDWVTWNQIFLLIDIACCCAVFFPIIWSIRSLREASKTDGKAARNLQKLTLFRQFYVVVVGYLYFTRIIVPAMGAVVSFKHGWFSSAAEEGASLIFYIFTFYKFQPTDKNPYLAIDDEEEEAAAQALGEDDDTFEL